MAVQSAHSLQTGDSEGSQNVSWLLIVTAQTGVFSASYKLYLCTAHSLFGTDIKHFSG